MIKHGGDLDIIEKNYNIAKSEIIDFSGNINPLGVSSNIKEKIANNLDILSTYPDKDYIDLKKSISNYCNCNYDNILVGCGASELISLCIKNIMPKKTLVVSPSYSEYERELKIINCNTTLFYTNENDFSVDIEKLINEIKKVDLVILCNPNNPTGSAINKNDIKKILENCKFLMVDETYAEFSNDEDDILCSSLTNTYENLFVIRGTSKFFSVPGIRLGYAICGNKKIIEDIENKKLPWSVNSIANLIGITMFNDKEYIDATIKLITTQKKYILKELSPLKNLKIYDSKCNFLLCKILNNKTTSTKLFETLIKKKILIRDAKNFPFLDERFFRFCILKEEENKTLIKNLKNIL